MEFGQYQLQIFVGLILILGAAGIVMADDLMMRRKNAAKRKEPAPAELPKRDWNVILESGKQHASERDRETVPPRRTFIVKPVEFAMALPTGFQDTVTLYQLVHRKQLVSGLVVSVLTREPQGRPLVESLIGAGDFAGCVNNREFVLVYPQERGLSARRRLSLVAGKLEETGSECGGVEARREPLGEAMSAASKRRMQGGRILAMPQAV